MRLSWLSTRAWFRGAHGGSGPGPGFPSRGFPTKPFQFLLERDYVTLRSRHRRTYTSALAAPAMQSVRVDFKVVVIAFRVMHGACPSIAINQFVRIADLHSSALYQLHIPSDCQLLVAGGFQLLQPSHGTLSLWMYNHHIDLPSAFKDIFRKCFPGLLS